MHYFYKSIFPLLITLGLATLVPVSFLNAELGEDLTWKFRVFLDKKEVGEHDYRVRSLDGMTKVETQARFDVKILFINAFRYRHQNTEYWDEVGMKRIDAYTVQNGDEFIVRGERVNGQFLLSDGEEETKLPENIMSFAYWNPDILDERRLLNSQTGDYETVEVVDLGPDTVEYDGQVLAARKYELRLPKTSVTIWYGADCARWLALESPAKGGRVIRYEPVELPVAVGFAMDKFPRVSGNES